MLEKDKTCKNDTEKPTRKDKHTKESPVHIQNAAAAIFLTRYHSILK